MRKYFILLMMLCSAALYGQTWTETGIEDSLSRECKVITQEQFWRLLQNYMEDNNTCKFYYYDVLELGKSIPQGLKDEYYLLIRVRYAGGLKSVLAYGKTETGRLEVWFHGYTDSRIGSDECKRQFVQLVKRVRGENTELTNRQK